MTRLTIRILMVLALGIVTTVGVAWGCALWSVSGGDLEAGDDPTRSMRNPVPITSDEYQRLSSFGIVEPANCRIVPGTLNGLGFVRAEYWVVPVERWEGELVIIGGAGQVHRETFAGWPLYALNCQELDDSERLYQQDPGLPRTQRELWPLRFGFDVDEEIDLGGPWVIQRPIPLRPIFPGFIINTLFYAAIWYILFFGFSHMKRAIRTRRGRCPMCGYDLRGAVDGSGIVRGCSECGWGRANG